jgi:hypothetical protein
MGTTSDVIASWYRREIELVEAFGVSAERVPASDDSIEFLPNGGLKIMTRDGMREFPGASLTDTQAEAIRKYLRPTPEPKRGPTWRDVFRAMHAAGYRLKIEERDGGYVKWIVPVGTMGEVASIIRETLGGRVSWTVELYGYLSYSVRLNNPPPSDVLDAARLVKLLDTPPELLKSSEAAILSGKERS